MLDEEAVLVFTLAPVCLSDLDRDEWGIISLSTQPKDTSCSHYEIPQMFTLTLTKSVMLFSEDLFVGCLPSLQRIHGRDFFTVTTRSI